MEELSEVKKFYSSEHILRAFKKMAHFKYSSQLCDVTLVAGDRHIPCHKVVIAAFSDYFSAMFTTDFPEQHKDVIHLCDMDPEALEALIRYAYTAELEIRVDNVENLLSVSCMIQIDEVQEACSEFMEHQLHPSNCLGIRAFADGHGCKELFKKADHFTSERFCEVIKNQEFLLLSNQQVGELLSSEDLNVKTEAQVLEALMMWANHDKETRKPLLPDLLAKIRLPLLSPQYLVDNVEGCPLFQDLAACRELILEAMKFQLLPERRFQLQSTRTRPRKSTVGGLYVVGGMDTSKGPINIERFDMRTNTWTTIASTSTRRLQFGSAVLQEHLYIVGGRDGLRTLNTVERFNPETKEWHTVTPMNTHRHGVGVGILGGPIYAVGGHDGWSYLNTVERYDHNTKQWSFVSSMCTPRSTVGVGVLNGKLYAVGGRDGSSCLNSVEVYNPHTNKWTMVCPMMKRRGGVGVSILGGYLYALGGHDAPASQDCSQQFDSVERYDSNTDQWTMIAPMTKCRDAVGVSWLGDRLYAIGGYDGTGYLKAVEYYDPITNEWHAAAPLKIGRAGACAQEFMALPVSFSSDGLLCLLGSTGQQHTKYSRDTFFICC